MWIGGERRPEQLRRRWIMLISADWYRITEFRHVSLAAL